jgi:hypothetical protein
MNSRPLRVDPVLLLPRKPFFLEGFHACCRAVLYRAAAGFMLILRKVLPPRQPAAKSDAIP